MVTIELPATFIPNLLTYAGILITALFLTRIYAQHRMNHDLKLQAEINAVLREEAALDAQRTLAEREKAAAEDRGGWGRLTIVIVLFVVAAIASIYLSSL